MAGHKSLLIGLRWVVAGRQRKCYHSKKHSISKGDRVLEVKVGLSWYGYCEDCGREMLRAAIAAATASLNGVDG
jgi:RNA polymerase-binding transcription factor DksA